MPIRLVFPGDLITSSDWNELAAIVNTLEARVAELEQGGGDEELRITQVLPSGVVTAGDTIRIVGSGFGFTKATHSVFFGSTRASIFGNESTDTLLVVQIPDPVAGATPGGTPITMTVGNLSEFATWPLTIKSKPVQVGGALEFGFLAASPATPTVDEAITYTFRLASLSNANLNVLITPDLDLPTAPSGVVEVHDADGQVRTDRTIALPAGAAKTIGVKITRIPNLPTGTTFNLSVTASAPGVQSRTEVLPPQMVGVAGESPDPTITNLTFSNVAEGTATFAPAAAGDTVAGTLTIPGASATRVTIELDATFAGIPEGATFHYLPSAEVVTGTGWSAARNALLTPSKYTVPAPGAQEFPGFDIDAPASGQAVIRFTLTREGATTNNKRSITLRVQRS